MNNTMGPFAAQQRRSMMSVVVIAFFAVGISAFLIQKGSEAASEIELLNNGPLAMRRAALMQELGEGAASSSQAAADTSGWKTYRNEQYGFEVKYPQDWEAFSNTLPGNYGYIDFSFRNKMYNGSYEWPGLRIQTIPFEESEIRGWGVHPAKIFSEETAKNDIVAIYFNLDDQKIYATCALYAHHDLLLVETCNKILSTFKFIK